MSSKPELERHIEERVIKWAKNQGWRVRKMNGLGYRSWPDRMFIGPGFVAFIEFKRPKEVPTTLQQRILDELVEFGHNARYFDDSDAAIGWLEALASKAASKESRSVDDRTRRSGAVPRSRAR